MRLIAFPFHDWRKGQREGMRTRDLHILEWLSRSPEVESLLVVDRPVSLAERLGRRDGWYVDGDVVMEARFGGGRVRLTRVGERCLVLDQATRNLVGPFIQRRGWWFDAFASQSASDAISWAVAAVGPVDGCIAWQPAVAPAVEALGAPFVFDSLDNWLIHPAFAKWRGQSTKAYSALLPGAQAVFVSAPASEEALRDWRDDIEVVPNGVDPETFRHVFSRPADLPDGPVVGYIGKLARRIDADLVASTARALPSVHFVFVGPILDRDAVAAMRGVHNILMIGDRHYRDVPAYVQHFDLGWIPHSVGAGETGGDPIKLYEYWAAGKDVVSTKIDGMDAWAGDVALVEDANQAAQAIGGILDGSRSLPRPEVPQARTWREITNRILEPLL